jgi:hypothetical protein
MKNLHNLEILYLSNYEYILYSSSDGDLFLTLTRECGFGVYSFTIEVKFTDIENREQTEKKIHNIRSQYMENSEDFSKKHVEIVLESSETKIALDKWVSKK